MLEINSHMIIIQDYTAHSRREILKSQTGICQKMRQIFNSYGDIIFEVIEISLHIYTAVSERYLWVNLLHSFSCYRYITYHISIITVN